MPKENRSKSVRLVNGPTLSPPTTTSLQDKDIAQRLQKLYKTDVIRDYACHFALFNLRTDRFIDVIGAAQATPGQDCDAAARH